MSKYTYGIMHLPIKRYLKWWLDKMASLQEFIVGFSNENPAYLINCLKAPFISFKLGGRTIQDGIPTPENPIEIKNVEGKNKLKLTDGIYTNNGITAVVNNGRVTLNGTSTSYSVCAIPVEIINFDSSKDYGFSLQNIIGIGTQVSETNSCYILYATANNDTIVQLTPLRATPTNSLIKNNLSESCAKVRITSSTGVSYNNYSFNLQVEDNEVTPYVPYNTIQIKKYNKNLFDENILKQNKNSEDTEAYIFDNNNNLKNIIPIIPFKENTSYTFTYTAKQVSGNPRLIFKYTDGTYDNIGTGTISTSYTQYTATSNSNKTLLCIDRSYSFSDKDSFYIKKNSAQLEEGSQATSYVAHAEKTYNFPLSEGQKLMQDGTIENKVVNEWGEYACTGNEAWKFFDLGNNKKQYYLDNFSSIIHSATNINIISNIAKGVILADRYNYNNSVYTVSGGFGFRIDEITSLADFKAELAQRYANGTPVIVHYKLATPDETDFTTDQQAVIDEIISDGTYKDVTHVSATALLDPLMEIEYKQKR